MDEPILRADEGTEAWTAERCFILELSNSERDEALSIARARVPAGVTTRWHRLHDIVERYVIIAGTGVVEVGESPAREVRPGDVVLIPAGCRQRVACGPVEELVFLALCTPRFRPQAYEDVDPAPIGQTT